MTQEDLIKVIAEDTLEAIWTIYKAGSFKTESLIADIESVLQKALATARRL